MTEIFGVTLDEFTRLSVTGELEPTPATEEVASTELAVEGAPTVEPVSPVTVSAPPVEAPRMLGVCARCGKAIYDEKSVGIRTPKFLCVGCKAAIIRKKKETAEKERMRLAILRERNVAYFRKSLWMPGAVIGGVILLLTLFAWQLFPFYLGAGILIYLAVVQIRWDNNFLSEVMDATFGKTFSMSGVIFSLDLDGILWLITVKLGLAILSILLTLVVTVLGFTFCMILAPFFFPFTLRKAIRDMRDCVLVD